ncbi:tryptophan-rich sensory protein [Paracoccus sp. JM45]|uniref:tryptophan-rich sensory protein n=1 Tax=Paracoccus sp. JM45 TaxID=2283626 RepID=UPI000E6C649F|nr:tryptophan-rich sensory protein [Paracoccus sp. JM45]RJE80835.1 tryptophan-rich sensory protein [Paracoccus sp. JM45]
MQNRTLALLVLAATIAFAVSPMIFPGFAGYSADQFPIPQQDPPVQPAGWAFSIWGIIYLWLIVGAAFGVWRRVDDDDWASMRSPLLVSLAVGFLWIPVAQYLPGLATLMILAMLASALVAMLWAGRQDPWFEGRPVALYAGWLTAASGVSIGIWLAGHGILGQQVAAILCLTGVCALALFVQSLRPEEWAYPLAIIWALIGVIAANISSGNWTIVGLAGVGAVLLAGRALMSRRLP